MATFAWFLAVGFGLLAGYNALSGHTQTGLLLGIISAICLMGAFITAKLEDILKRMDDQEKKP